MSLIKRIFLSGLLLLLISNFRGDYYGNMSRDELRLLLFYGSFDEHHDIFISIKEEVDFFEWCKENIKYEAHEGYQSPIETYRNRCGDCLDMSLLFAHFLYVYCAVKPLIGKIAVNNHGEEINHACCLLPVPACIREDYNRQLGYRVSYFVLPDDDLSYIVIDLTHSTRFGQINTSDYYLIRADPLSEYYFSDMQPITSP